MINIFLFAKLPPKELKNWRKLLGISDTSWKFVDYWRLGKSSRFIIHLVQGVEEEEYNQGVEEEEYNYYEQPKSFWLIDISTKKFQCLFISGGNVVISEGGPDLPSEDKLVKFDKSTFNVTCFGGRSWYYDASLDLINIDIISESYNHTRQAMGQEGPLPYYSYTWNWKEFKGSGSSHKIDWSDEGKEIEFLMIPYIPLDNILKREWRNITLGRCALTINPKENLGFLIKGDKNNIPPFKILVISEDELLIEIFKTDKFVFDEDLLKSEHLEIWQRIGEAGETERCDKFYRWGIRLADGKVFKITDPILFLERYSDDLLLDTLKIPNVKAKKLFYDEPYEKCFWFQESIERLPKIEISKGEERKDSSIMIKIKLPYKINFVSSLSICYYNLGSMVSTSEILFDNRLAMFSLSYIFKPNPKIFTVGMIDKFPKTFRNVGLEEVASGSFLKELTIKKNYKIEPHIPLINLIDSSKGILPSF
ncbi:MAG: hypothetical protein ABIK72_05570 [candidate division WOR-3 bacterium]